MNLPRNVGFELEFAGQSWEQIEILKARLEEIGFSVRLDRCYVHSNGDQWHIKTDTSCGWEIASPILRTYDDLIKAMKVPKIVSDLGFSTNSSCGLHVHIDMIHVQSDSFNNLMRFLSRYEEAFFSLAENYRRNSTYCQPLRDSTVADIKAHPDYRPSALGRAWSSKHYWVNGTHLGGIGTIEFRLMSSTLKPEKIIGWIMFLLQVVNFCFKGKSVQWGSAKCANARDLIQTMLGQGGFYGPFSEADEWSKTHIVLARKWAIGTFTKGESKTKIPKMTKFTSLNS